MKISLFEDSVIGCARLSIDCGDAFVKPVLTPFDAEIALGLIYIWLVGEN
jgi:2-(3-amino-3-carboxypropyl)histidine synthase